MRGVAEGRHWMIATERVILSTWLFKSSTAEGILWWAFTWHTDTFLFLPTQRGLSTYFSPGYFFVSVFVFLFCFVLTGESANTVVFDTDFPIMFLPSPWSSSQTTGHSIQLHIWPLLPPSKVHNQVHCLMLTITGNVIHWNFTLLQHLPQDWIQIILKHLAVLTSLIF